MSRYLTRLLAGIAILIAMIVAGCGSSATPLEQITPEAPIDHEATATHEAGLDDPVSPDDPLPDNGDTVPSIPEDAIIEDAEVVSVEILFLESFPLQVMAEITSVVPDGCTNIRIEPAILEGDTFKIAVKAWRPADAEACTLMISEDTQTVSLPVYGLAAGTYTVDVNGVVEAFTLDMDNILPEGEAPEAGAPVYVDTIDITLLESFPVQVRATVKGNLPDPCTILEKVETTREGNTFTIQIVAYHPPEATCIAVLAPFEETVDLDVAGLSAGTYTVVSHGVSAAFTLDADN